MAGLSGNYYNGKITQAARKTNQLSPNQVLEGIAMIQDGGEKEKRKEDIER